MFPQPPEEISMSGVTEDEALLLIKELLAWELSEYNYEGLKDFFFNTQGAYYFSNPTVVEDMLRYKKEYTDYPYRGEHGNVDFSVRELHTGYYRPIKAVDDKFLWKE